MDDMNLAEVLRDETAQEKVQERKSTYEPAKVRARTAQALPGRNLKKVRKPLIDLAASGPQS